MLPGLLFQHYKTTKLMDSVVINDLSKLQKDWLLMR